jgi:hypothetical protein
MGEILSAGNKEFKNVATLDFKNPKAVGTKFTGKFISTKNVKVGLVAKNIYTFEVIDGDMPTTMKVGNEFPPVDVEVGDTVQLWGCASLDRSFFDDAGNLRVNAGDTIKLTYEGKKKTKKGIIFHAFIVERESA